jgi:hypothetical protein
MHARARVGVWARHRGSNAFERQVDRHGMMEAERLRMMEAERLTESR